MFFNGWHPFGNFLFTWSPVVERFLEREVLASQNHRSVIFTLQDHRIPNEALQRMVTLVMATTIISGIRPLRAKNSIVAAVCPRCESPSVMYNTG
jgi:hypothetical protein